MTALVRVQHRDTVQAVLIVRAGTGFRVGIGGLLSGRIEREASGHINERQAVEAACALADREDLLTVWG